ncbi:7TM diverse intracellular signaling domain-containing protein [Fibrisoma montanum]|nr:7TM diverse intracellular signaling domain-containing protein [Fibrisoma montanum]
MFLSNTGRRPNFVIRCFLISLLLFRLTDTWAAEPLTVADSKRIYAVADHSDMLTSSVHADQIGKHWSAFRPFDYHQVRIDVDTNNVYWFRFTVRNQTDESLYLVVPTLGYATVLLYEWSNGRTFPIGKGGLQAVMAEKYLPASRDIMRLPLRPGQQKTYLLRMNRFDRKSLPASIYPQYALIRESHPTDVIEGLLFGILLAVVLYQLLIYAVTHERDYLLLGGYLFAFTLQLAIFSGHFYELFRDIPFWLNDRLFYAIPIMTALLSFAFAYYFLRIKTRTDPIIRYGFRLLFGFFLIFLIAAVFGFGRIAVLYQNTTPLAAAFMLYTGTRIYRTGYKPAFLFLIAYSVPIFAILYLSLYIYGILTYSWLNHTMLLMSSDAHAILFSIAIAYKIKTYKDETERLIVAQNIQLEQKVAERTRELAEDKIRIQEQSDQLKMVMKELHHRVKNNLSIVSGLLSLQSNQLTDEQAIRAFQEGQQRIEVMSLIHQQLYKTDQISTIDIRQYIRELTAGLIHAYGFGERSFDFQFHSDFDELNIDLAIPLGLILNELLTNAFKYAYRAVDKPVLIINLHKQAGLVLEVQDNGPGIDVSNWERSGGSFGKRLIKGLSQQTGGEFTIDNTNGTRFQLHIPESELALA